MFLLDPTLEPHGQLPCPRCRAPCDAWEVNEGEVLAVVLVPRTCRHPGLIQLGMDPEVALALGQGDAATVKSDGGVRDDR